jgi:hypothetical protein
MNPVHYPTKRSFWFLRAAGAIAFAAFCATIILRREPGSGGWWLGLGGLTFFGFGAIVGIVQGARRGPRLTLDEQGVHDRTLGVGVIAWSDIVSAQPYGVAKQPFIGLELRDPAKYLARASTFKRLLARLNGGGGMPALSVNLAGLDADPMEVAELIMSRCMDNDLPPGLPPQAAPRRGGAPR